MLPVTKRSIRNIPSLFSFFERFGLTSSKVLATLPTRGVSPYFFVQLHTASWRVPLGGGKFDDFLRSILTFLEGPSFLNCFHLICCGKQRKTAPIRIPKLSNILCFFCCCCVLLVTAASVAKLSREIINVLVPIKKKFQFQYILLAILFVKLLGLSLAWFGFVF